jgi:hypothetical protein
MEFYGQRKNDQYNSQSTDDLKKKPQQSAPTGFFLLFGHLMKAPETAFTGLAGCVCAAPISKYADGGPACQKQIDIDAG